MIAGTLEGLDRADHDVCVIGSGPAGLSVALELARLKKRVLVLESGSAAADVDAQALSDAEIVDPARHDDMRIAVARRLGGTSNLWGGRCVPYDPIDFEPRDVVGGVRWPLAYADVAPHFARAVEIAGAGAAVFHDAALDGPAGDFEVAALERWSTERRLQLAHRRALAEDMRLDVRLHATAIAFERDGDRIAAVGVVGRDGTTVRVPVKCLVLAAGGLECTRLLLADQRRAPLRYGGPDGALGRYYMGHVIGEIADIVFADARLERSFDFRIDAYGSYVRPRLSPSVQLQRDARLLNSALWPVVPTMGDPRHRSGLLSAVALALAVKPVGGRLVAEAIRKRHSGREVLWARHGLNILRDIPGTATGAARLLWHRYVAAPPLPGFFQRNAGHRYGLAYHAEQSPSAASRVRLTDACDRTGLPSLSIDLRFSTEDAVSVVETHRRLAAWLEANGVGQLAWRYPEEARVEAVLRQASHGTHQIGTARMAHAAADGVVDAALQVFDTPNLFVASSAVLPTSSQANPTLTVMALAVRLAQHLARL